MRRLLPLLAIPLLLSACANLLGTVAPGTGEWEGSSTGSATIELRGDASIALPSFSVAGNVVARFGEHLAVFQYGSEEKAAADAAKVDADGQSINGSVVTWKGPVHFFRHGRVIIVYVGGDTSLLAKLKEDGGDQFAGN